MKYYFKKTLKLLLYSMVIIMVLSVIFILALWCFSLGTAQPVIDANGKTIEGSISTIEKVTLGNLEQYVIIRGVDKAKPVMLFLHGGPGSPEFSSLTNKNKGLEENFVMVYWEQRGAGKSYSKNIPVESMNIDQFIVDTKELSEILIKKFGKEKIYIMAHSWGTLFGMLAINKYPELYHAYFGVGQNVSYEGERVSLEWVRQQAKNSNDKKGMEELAVLTLPRQDDDFKIWFDYLSIQREYVNKYGGSIHDNSTSMTAIIIEFLLSKEYTISDKINYWKGVMFSLENLGSEMMNTNLFDEIDAIQIPVYILQGRHDYTTPYPQAKKFLEQLKAPEKEFFTFENSAHSPLMEETEKFNKIILEKVDLNR